jgi:hypothetical protein
MPGESMQQYVYHPSDDAPDLYRVTHSIRFYNSETFSDVQVLMLGRRPLANKIARKSVAPVYTFNAHKIILSAGSTKFAAYFRSHPKVRTSRGGEAPAVTDLFGR